MENRKIKFRVWFKVLKRMYVVRELRFNRDNSIMILTNDTGGTAPNSYELMQFIGIRDKKFKEIYEGDIVKFGSLDKIGIIVFLHGRFIIEDQRFKHEHKIYNYDKKDPDTYLEVIGNIYKNPKLLKEDSILI